MHTLPAQLGGVYKYVPMGVIWPFKNDMYTIFIMLCRVYMYMFPQECCYIFPRPSASWKYNNIPSGNIYIYTLQSMIHIYYIYIYINLRWILKVYQTVSFMYFYFGFDLMIESRRHIVALSNKIELINNK